MIPLKRAQKSFCPGRDRVNKAIRFLDTLEVLKTALEFCYGGGATEPLLAARLVSIKHRITLIKLLSSRCFLVKGFQIADETSGSPGRLSTLDCP